MPPVSFSKRFNNSSNKLKLNDRTRLSKSSNGPVSSVRYKLACVYSGDSCQSAHLHSLISLSLPPEESLDPRLPIKYRDENSQPLSIRKICRLTPKRRKAIFKSLIKSLNHKISIENSQFMLNLYLKLSITSFKNKFQQKQLALYKSFASAQSGNSDQS